MRAYRIIPWREFNIVCCISCVHSRYSQLINIEWCESLQIWIPTKLLIIKNGQNSSFPQSAKTLMKDYTWREPNTRLYMISTAAAALSKWILVYNLHKGHKVHAATLMLTQWDYLLAATYTLTPQQGNTFTHSFSTQWSQHSITLSYSPV